MATTEEQVSWNLSQRLSDQIDNLIQGCRRASLNGRVLNCFHICKEIRLLINHHFNKKERRKVNVLEFKINNVSIEIKKIGLIEEEDEFEYASDSRENNLRKKLILLNNDRVILIERYRKAILRLLDEYGYLMERKKDASYMM